MMRSQITNVSELVMRSPMGLPQASPQHRLNIVCDRTFKTCQNWLGDRSYCISVKGWEIYEGLLQKNAEDVKGGAGQYFTLRALIKANQR